MSANRSRRRSLIFFLDTNILLDFYRARNESGLKLLEKLDGLRQQIVTTYQVEMEFKKNRQKVMLESHKMMKLPEMAQVPAFIAESKTTRALQSRMKSAKSLVDSAKNRLIRALKYPTSHDPVYRLIQRLFSTDTTLNLTREKQIRQTIRRLAFKRFILGYPPRKDSDTSIGDSLNWEWIIHCCNQSTCDMVIVSRDSDYGISIGDQSFINDWLVREFRNRVSKRRRIFLVDRLSTALKMLDVKVSKAEERAENDAIKPPLPVQNSDLLKLQDQLFSILERADFPVPPIPYIVCPRCGSKNLRRTGGETEYGDDWLEVRCENCGWRELA